MVEARFEGCVIASFPVAEVFHRHVSWLKYLRDARGKIRGH
jgi:hypothetical protein